MYCPNPSRLLLALVGACKSSNSTTLGCSTPSLSFLTTAASTLSFSRSYVSSSSSLRTSRLTSPSNRHDTPLDVVPAPLTAAQTARRNAPLERQKTDKRDHRQLPYNAYNLKLSQHIKQLTTWTDILSHLSTELTTTAYNRQTVDRYIHPNKKYTQLTHQTLHAITTQLIKYRRTRHRATSDSPLLRAALVRFIRIVECAAPAMYEGTVDGGRWRLMYHPYKYLRAVAEQWQKEADTQRKQRERVEEERREEEEIRREGGLTAQDIKRRIEEVRRKRVERQKAEAKAEAEGGPRRSDDDMVNIMRGMPTKEEARELAKMSGEEKLRMQIQAMLQQEQDRNKKESQPAKEEDSEKEEDPKPSRRERNKVQTFFTSPR